MSHYQLNYVDELLN